MKNKADAREYPPDSAYIAVARRYAPCMVLPDGANTYRDVVIGCMRFAVDHADAMIENEKYLGRRKINVKRASRWLYKRDTGMDYDTIGEALGEVYIHDATELFKYVFGTGLKLT